MVMLIKGYGTNHNGDLSMYYLLKKDLYEEGPTLPTSTLMHNMLNKYMTLVENNMLNTVSATEMKLVALQVKLKK